MRLRHFLTSAVMALTLTAGGCEKLPEKHVVAPIATSIRAAEPAAVTAAPVAVTDAKLPARADIGAPATPQDAGASPPIKPEPSRLPVPMPHP